MGNGTHGRRSLSGVVKLFGYGSSMILLALASLLIIPEMIAVDGRSAWGSIALGQAIGGIAAVVIGYGWQISGPTIIARGDQATRRRDYLESLVLKSTLFVPVASIAAWLAAILVTQRPLLAAIAAVSTACVGFNTNWFYVGMAQPFQMLLAQTVPRVLGSVVGIVWMRAGAGAMTALACQLGGMLVATALSSLWILRSHPRGLAPLPRRPVRATLRQQADGLGTSVASAVYVAAPLMIVSVVAPSIQPVYALVDKLQRQIGVGLSPVVSVLQGWVPRASRADRGRRSRQAMLLAGGLSLGLALSVLLGGPFLVAWVGAGEIEVGPWVYALMGCFVGLGMLEACIAQAVLPAMGRLRMAARATILSAAVGLPLTALGAAVSVEFALLGFLSGLLGRIILEVTTALRGSRTSDPSDADEANTDPTMTNPSI